MTPTKESLTTQINQAQTALNQKTGKVAPVAPTPAPVATPSTAITADSLKPVAPVVLTPPATPTIAPTLQANLEVNAEDAFTQAQTLAKKQAEGIKNSSLNDYITSLKESKGLTTLQNEAYAQKGGVNDITPELNDINDQIRREQLAQRRATEAVTKAGGQSKGQAQSQINNINRESLAKQADLSIIQQAVQGRYDSAREIADRAVSAQFEQQKIYNDALKFNYEENKDIFTTAEQREFETLLGNRNRKLQEEQENKKSIYELGIQASADGAPSSVVQQMLKAKTREEALGLGGRYIGALDRAAKQSQLYTSSLQQQKLLQELNPGETSNNSDLTVYGQQLAETGKLPTAAELKASGLSVAQVSEYAKQIPKQDGALISRTTGTKPSTLTAGQEDGISALYDISQKVAQLKELDTLRVKGVIPGLIGKTFGAQDQQKYVDLRGEIVDLLARARTGAALTTQEEKFYSDQLPGRVGQGVFGLFGVNTQDRIDNFSSKIDGTLQSKLNASNLAIQGYSTVKVGDTQRKVGEILDIGGVQYRVLPDGQLTDII